MWGHHQPDVSDHPEHDGDAPDGVVAVPLLLLGHQDEPEVGQDVGAQHLSVVYLSLLVFLRSECRNTQLCGQCQLVWRNSGNCDRMVLHGYFLPMATISHIGHLFKLEVDVVAQDDIIFLPQNRQ